MSTTARCDAPVAVPGVFTATTSDTGRRCVRAAGHDGVHRWSATWATMPPEAVEDAVRRAEAAWEDEDDPPGS